MRPPTGGFVPTPNSYAPRARKEESPRISCPLQSRGLGPTVGRCVHSVLRPGSRYDTLRNYIGRNLVHVEVFADYEFSRISRADLFLKHFRRSVERVRASLGRQKSGRRNSRRKADYMIDNEQFRFSLVGQFGELFGGRMVPCDKRLDAFGHPSEQLDGL